MMSDIALMLEEIRNKLDELDHKVDVIHQKVDQLKIFPQMTFWRDDSFNKPNPELFEIKDPVPNPYEIKCKGE